MFFANSFSKANHRRSRGRRQLRVEQLQDRLCPSLTLTQAGMDQGFSLSTFATDFPVATGVGPIGIAFPEEGGVLVGDYAGNVRLFPTDTDGQTALHVPPAQDYGFANATGMGRSGERIYMNQATNSRVVEINPDGTFNQVVVTIPNPVANNLTGMAVNPVSGHLFVSVPTTTGSFNEIVNVDPLAKTFTVFLSETFTDGLAFDRQGRVLYAATSADSTITGYDVETASVVFGPVSIQGGPDGLAVGQGRLNHKLLVNNNNGTVVELDTRTLTQTVIATGGSRGDLAYADPNDDSVLLTQTDLVMRLTPPHGGTASASVPFFIFTEPLPAASAKETALNGSRAGESPLSPLGTGLNLPGARQAKDAFFTARASHTGQASTPDFSQLDFHWRPLV
jgi:hypothetical protein